ncbi:MAG TPA: efflux RND transporter periplasmic adaptor subunit [Candidatus Tidjanibacter faecipullorum]|uniref:Efflux RND transporter periplasmic adaptor subunit n=1 Tax=Candidatus Tidjanibacter faecipullorum TaxID=2838766 RepID=A0A9D2DCU5_9BACT|nr:efflux RND transporter periplasmic adaptor subunit [Candidatus Tidjanibacter faecipullorum]
MRSSRLLWIAAAVWAAVALTGCRGEAKKSDTEAQETVSVKVEKARVEEVAQTVSFTANLEPNKTTYIVPSVAARIEKLNVEVGDRVKKGQILAELDKTQYNTNAIQLANLELDFARMQRVYETGGISKQEMDATETSINVLKETVANLEENLTLRSPFDGVVTLRNNEVGDLFSAVSGGGIYQVMQMNPLKAYVYVSEQYFPHVYMGMPVEVRLDIYPEETFSGKVSRIAPALDASSRTFEVEVTIPNPDMRLRPGMYARTLFNMGLERSVTVLDVAVQRMTGTNERYVYVVQDGHAERRFVTVGRQVGDRIEILDGLKDGEEVVIAGSARLLGGMAVSVMEGE